MDSKSLMIGDWVFVHCHIDKLAKVEGIYKKSIYTSIGGPWLYDEIEPIPLTPEILERNGVTINRFDDGEILTADYMVSEKYLISYNFLYDSLHISSWTGQHGNFSMRNIFNIHELQHALKLCGIDKTIEI